MSREDDLRMYNNYWPWSFYGLGRGAFYWGIFLEYSQSIILILLISFWVLILFHGLDINQMARFKRPRALRSWPVRWPPLRR